MIINSSLVNVSTVIGQGIYRKHSLYCIAIDYWHELNLAVEPKITIAMAFVEVYLVEFVCR